jgi:hypothetical protein
MKCLSAVAKISPRIVTASLTSNLATTIVSCYSPTNCSDEEDLTAFYKDMTDTLRDIPSHCPTTWKYYVETLMLNWGPMTSGLHSMSQPTIVVHISWILSMNSS